MGISFFNIRKWTKMIFGKSPLHVTQGMGKHFTVNELNGYFNDLTNKVTIQPEFLNNKTIPLVDLNNKEKVEFPVAIIQYALGCYDLFLETKNENYRDEFLLCTNWVAAKQNDNGSINNFYFIYPEAPYGAMCQGEAASLFLRACALTSDDEYLKRAEKALDFMCLDIKDGGVASISDDGVIFLEYSHRKPVFNGWVFSLFGLVDYYSFTKSTKYSLILNRSIKTYIQSLPLMNAGYWSMYDMDNRIASPFYHKLHIAQLEALYRVTNDPIFTAYSTKFIEQQKRIICRGKAFLKKAFQKIKE